MNTPSPPIDIVTLFIAIDTALFGPELAAVIGPYAVILLGAALGAAWSATRREPGTRGSTLLHMLLMMGWALLVTVPAAAIAGRTFGWEAKWLLGPVAVVIAGIGPDWPNVGRWGIGVLKGLAERWVGSKGERQ
jgi:hypothetical protein